MLAVDYHSWEKESLHVFGHGDDYNTSANQFYQNGKRVIAWRANIKRKLGKKGEGKKERMYGFLLLE